MTKQGFKTIFYLKYPKHISEILFNTIDDSFEIFDIQHVIDF